MVLVDEPCCTVSQPFCGKYVCVVFGEFELESLVFSDFSAEGLTLFEVFDSFLD